MQMTKGVVSLPGSCTPTSLCTSTWADLKWNGWIGNLCCTSAMFVQCFWRVYSKLRWSEMNWVRRCNFSFTWKKVSKSLLRIAFQSVMCSFFSKRMNREAEPISRKIAYCKHALLSCGKKTLSKGHSTRLGMQHHVACLKAFITDRCKSAIPPQFPT